MADISVTEVPLPSSVDQMLREICTKHSQPPLDTRLRRELASAGKEASLKLLRTISCADKIRNLNGFVVYMLRNSTAAPTQESVCSSTPHGILVHFTFGKLSHSLRSVAEKIRVKEIEEKKKKKRKN